jgi:glycosyltransferase involved in cell wall biosynthesis
MWMHLRMSAATRYHGSPIRSISAILPARNEAGNLAEVAAATLDALQDVVPSFDLTIVDDGSSDATGRIADELAVANNRVTVIHHRKSLGYGSALRSGIASATKQYTLILDADRQFNPAELDRFMLWDDTYDIIAGFRARRHDALPRRILGRAFRLLVRLFFGVKERDPNCGFKLIRTSLLKGMHLQSRGALISTEILYLAKRNSASARDVYVTHFARRSGQPSGASLRVIARAARETIVLRRRFSEEQRLASLKQLETDDAGGVLDAAGEPEDGLGDTLS